MEINLSELPLLSDRFLCGQFNICRKYPEPRPGTTIVDHKWLLPLMPCN